MTALRFYQFEIMTADLLSRNTNQLLINDAISASWYPTETSNTLSINISKTVWAARKKFQIRYYIKCKQDYGLSLSDHDVPNGQTAQPNTHSLGNEREKLANSWR
jgi:hypothetical protein